MPNTQPSATGQTYDSSGWSQDDPSKGQPPAQPSGPSPLAPQSPLADQSDIGQMEAAKIGAEEPYREKLLKVLNSPQEATAHLEKVKDAPNPQDYHKYSLEFASAMAVIGAISGRWTRHAGNASLNAFSAALNGWHQGNVEAYEQASKQWEENTKKTLENNNVELEKYHEIMQNKSANIDQMMAAMQLAGAESQNKIIMDFAASGNYTGVFKAVDKMAQANARLQAGYDKLSGLRAEDQGQISDQVNYLNSNPDKLAALPLKDYLTLRGTAESMGLKLNDQPTPPQDQIQSAVDEVGQYRANPATVLSRMPAAYRTEFWNQMKAQYPDWSQQTFNAQNVGGTSGARTEATRAANLDIILNSAKAAVPQALEAAEALPRGQYVPVNKAIQAYQAGTSSPELKSFAIANLQLAELWARAMNPTGVMRSSDRQIALDMLSTADGTQAYKAAVNALLQAINREKGAVSQTEAERGSRTTEGPPAGGVIKYDADGNRVSQ